MYKSRLQEICQQRGWPLPEYAVSRDGPEHNPRFRATVSVNGLTFDSPDASMSSKDAQGKAAHAAIDHLSAAAAAAAAAPSFQCSSPAQGNNPMYKSQIEEICRLKRWSAPKYNVIRDGPDHNPRFHATVTVNGSNFDAPDLSRSSKEAQGKAAQVAVRHLALTVPSKQSPPTPPSSPSENKIPYKSQLQIYVQKKNIINPPIYDIVHDGSAPALRFKATVTVDGRTFDGTRFFHTLREAEHDAAKVALVSLALEENPQEETILYKNLLQELLQKKGFSLPKYSTARDGASHMPIFSSVVEIEGESFVGDVARSKKQAEMNAAKVAWDQLKKRFNARSKSATSLPPGFSAGLSVEEHLRLASLQSESISIKNLEQGKPLPVPVSYVKINEDRAGKNQEEKCRVEDDSSTLPVSTILKDDQGAHSYNEIMVNDIGHSKRPPKSHHKSDFEVATEKEVHSKDTLSEVGSSSSSTPSDSSDPPIEDMISDSPTGQTTCSLPSNRVRVHHRKPDMRFPKGATLLPFSDDKWVAVVLDGSNHEGKKLEDNLIDENDSSSVTVAAIHQDDQFKPSSREIVVNGNGHTDNLASSLHNMGMEVSTKEEDRLESILFEDWKSSSYPASNFSDHPTADVDSEFSATQTTCSFHLNRVQVYPRKPGMVLPNGASVLPFSDDKWVAVRLDLSNHEDAVSV